MSEMIERVAAALKQRARLHQITILVEADAMDLAKAAIEAMREPTEAMKLAPPDVNFGPEDAAFAWKQMIDAALETEKEPAVK
jgi:hypothetical protein